MDFDHFIRVRDLKAPTELFIRVMNDRNFSSNANILLFDAMNAYFLGFFDRNAQSIMAVGPV
jgi:hypothetical protein